jgi:hypothetical protein
MKPKVKAPEQSGAFAYAAALSGSAKDKPTTSAVNSSFSATD